MRRVHTIKVFVGSPGDLQQERQRIPVILEELAALKQEMGYRFEAIGWEDTLPGKGRPQELINRDLDSCDIAILMLWRRWGTPTGTHSSGFYEEFVRCMKQEKPILLFLKEISADLRRDPGPQLKKVLEFRQQLEEDRKLLYARFPDISTFEPLLRRHLSQWLDQYEEGREAEDLLVDPSLWLRRIARDHEKSRNLLTTVIQTSSLREALSLILTDEARQRLMNGDYERSEFLFHTALDTAPLVDALSGYCHFLIQTGRLNEADSIVQQLLAAPNMKNDPGIENAVRQCQGALADARGDLDAAAKAYERVLDLSLAIDCQDYRITALMHLGCIARDRGQMGEAISKLRSCIELMEKQKSRETASAWNHLTDCYIRIGNPQKAVESNRIACELAEEFGQPREIALARYFWGLLLLFSNRPNDALKAFEGAVELARKTGDYSLEMLVEGGRANIYMRDERWVEAEEALQMSLSSARRRGRADHVTIAALNLAQVLTKVKRPKEALKYLEEAESVMDSNLSTKHSDVLARTRQEANKMISNVSNDQNERPN